MDAAFKEGLENPEAILTDWRKGKFETNKEAYHSLFKEVDDKEWRHQQAVRWDYWWKVFDDSSCYIQRWLHK